MNFSMRSFVLKGTTALLVAGAAAWMPRSKVSIEMRVRRVRTSSRWRAPSWVTA